MSGEFARDEVRSRVQPTYSAHDRRVKGLLGRGIVRVLDMKPTDPIVELVFLALADMLV